jgi:uncharacterized membrane protein (UPF0136 family)
MSEDLRQSLSVWGLALAAGAIAVLLAYFPLRLPAETRDGIITLLALVAIVSGVRSWRRRKAGGPA